MQKYTIIYYDGNVTKRAIIESEAIITSITNADVAFLIGEEFVYIDAIIKGTPSIYIPDEVI